LHFTKQLVFSFVYVGEAEVRFESLKISLSYCLDFIQDIYLSFLKMFFPIHQILHQKHVWEIQKVLFSYTCTLIKPLITSSETWLVNRIATC